MKKEEEIKSADHPGTEPVAQNPNPRANENLAENVQDNRQQQQTGSDSEDVGTEITDGEDG